jgi:hypothetical protein
MAHYLFTFSTGDRDQAIARLQAEMWGIDADERHRDGLVAGDLTLIYVAAPDGGFIGRAELATGAHEWTPSEARAYPGSARGGVRLSRVERWDRAVPMAIVAAHVDPSGSNSVVQANARAGLRAGVVRITAAEYDAALTASRAYQRR